MGGQGHRGGAPGEAAEKETLVSLGAAGGAWS
jgi:hypothetical protein